MQMHMLHPHPNRRHYPHHLLDHFSRDLTPRTTSSVSWQDILPTDSLAGVSDLVSSSGYLNTKEPIIGARETEKEENTTERKERETLPSSTAEQHLGSETYSPYQDAQVWPFYGTESRVLPSGRRISFLRDACIGFSRASATTQEKDNTMDVVCPRAFKEAHAAFMRRPTPTRRTFFQTSQGPRVAELRRRFTDIENKVMEEASRPSENVLRKIRNEALKGAQKSGLQLHPDTALKRGEASQMYDSSRRILQLPKAPKLRSPNLVDDVQTDIQTESVVQRSKNRIKKMIAQQKPDQTRRNSPSSPVKSPSPSRQKDFKSTKTSPVTPTARVGSVTHITSGVKGDSQKRNRSGSPQSKGTKSTPGSQTKPIRPCQEMKKPPLRTGRVVVPRETQNKPGPVALLEDQSSSESSVSSVVMVDRGIDTDDTTSSTYEELSAGEISDRNFLVDFGDPSHFYFRNEWEARMRRIEMRTEEIKKNMLDTQWEENVRFTVRINQLVQDRTTYKY